MRRVHASRSGLGSRSLFGVLFCSTCLFLLPLLGGLALASDEVEMIWKKPAGAELFESGKAAFEAEKYEEAHDAFKDAKRHAKNKATKTELARWTLGAIGGNEIAELKKRAESGRGSAAYDLAQKNFKRYEQSPIGPAYREFIKTLEKELFQMLEDFDRKSARYSEKYGKTFIDDPAIVKQGKMCLKWQVDKKNIELKVKSLPKDIDSYAKSGSLILWLHLEGGAGAYSLIFPVPGKGSAARTGATVDNAFIMPGMKPHKGGWKRIEVPLSKFTAQGDVSWDRVTDFRIQFLGGRRFECYVDSIMLKK